MPILPHGGAGAGPGRRGDGAGMGAAGHPARRPDAGDLARIVPPSVLAKAACVSGNLSGLVSTGTDDKLPSACATPTPSFGLPTHGSLVLTGTLTVNGQTTRGALRGATGGGDGGAAPCSSARAARMASVRRRRGPRGAGPNGPGRQVSRHRRSRRRARVASSGWTTIHGLRTRLINVAGELVWSARRALLRVGCTGKWHVSSRQVSDS